MNWNAVLKILRSTLPRKI
jgi:hypothetical protein